MGRHSISMNGVRSATKCLLNACAVNGSAVKLRTVLSHGWQAAVVAIRPEVIDIMHKLLWASRVTGLSCCRTPTGLHTTFWA